ncbi:GNAT family N-acetyltransferase [Diaminobutyricibacter tongyongensis]|uniref:GNAT family N-acetyltransferase n=1 Tax=Leifsonia tongyongensis TaxID=1268043 RepID=A0A6L9Y2Z3_9MICO|nr:GNAT family N-acetyltransferase [Diaminobutyricibacter tongyongensis]NEN07787.1 GNAT family N-acetyltransferase [Diaminobutyricibacter tongyongensis]
MTAAFVPARYEFEYPDTAGYPDGTGALSQDQKILIDEVLDMDVKPEFDFGLVDDVEHGVYVAFVGDTEIGGITYSLLGTRVVLLAASVYPEYRHQGVATEMIRRILEIIRSQNRTVTIICPIVRTFIDSHPQYEDLVDVAHPGVKHVEKQ